MLHEYKWDVEYHLFGVYLGYIIFAAVFSIVAFLCYAFFKPFIIKKQKEMFKRVKKYDTAHD